jgi:hypothetical protein
VAKIRGRTDLTEARDEVVARFESLLTDLKACTCVPHLDKMIYTLKATRVDEALADLIVALEMGQKGGSNAEETTDDRD